mgnify:CR=1 FL=1
MSDDIIDISPNKDVDTPDDDGPFEAGSDQRFRLDLDPEAIDETLRELGSRMRKQFDRHRHSKVRLTYKGKPLIADIPIAVFIASEAASFWWMGPLRVLLVNLGARTFIEVELVNAADDLVAEGNALYMDAEVEEAEVKYRQALVMRPGDPSALYHLGVLLRVTGRKDEAIESLQEAADWGDHPDSTKASEMLTKMKVHPLVPRED